MDQSNIERLAVAQALYQAAAELVSTKDPDSLRSQADDHYRSLYAMTGAKSFDVKIGGEKVGTFSLTVSKPTESVEVEQFSVTNPAALQAWDKGDPGLMSAFLNVMAREYAEYYFAATGEMPPGCELASVVRPGDPGGEVTRTTLRIDRDAVARAMGSRLGGQAVALLEGGA